MSLSSSVMQIHFLALSRVIGVFTPQEPMYEATGTTADSSANGYHISSAPGPVFDLTPVEGSWRYGAGYRFDGVNDYMIQTTTGAWNLTGDLCITMVFRSNMPAGVNQHLIRMSVSGTDTTAMIYITPSGQVVYFHQLSGTNTSIVSAAGVVLPNRINTLTFRRTAGATNITIKINGVEVINQSGGGIGGNSNNNLYIGTNEAVNGDWFNGVIYDIRVWNQLVNQATLDAIVDPDDTTYRHKAEGNEYVYYPMETLVDYFADLSGNGNDLAETGTVRTYYGDDAKHGVGIGNLSATNHLSLGSGAYSMVDDWTCAFKYKHDTPASSSKTICVYEDGTDGFRTINHVYVDSLGKLLYYHGDGSAVHSISSSSALVDGQVYSVHLRRDNTAKSLELYIDGVLDATESYTGNPYSGASSPFRIGYNVNIAQGSAPDLIIYSIAQWNKLADETAVNNWLDSNIETNRRYAPDSPVAYYDFGRANYLWDAAEHFTLTEVSGPFTKTVTNGLGANPNDSSGNGRTLTVSGATRAQADSTWGGGYQFDGSNDYLRTTDATIIGGAPSISEFLVLKPTTATPSGSEVFTDMGIASGSSSRFAITREPSGELILYLHTTTVESFTTSGVVLSTTTPNTIEIICNDTGKTVKMWVNGTLEIDTTYGATLDFTSIIHLALGADNSDSSPVSGFSGSMYEYRRWHSALSESVLHQIADANDDTYKGVAEGTEVAYWKMEKDLRGFADGIILDGVADYIDVNDDAALAHTGDMTVAMRIYNNAASGVSLPFDLTNGAGGADRNFRILQTTDNGGQYYFGVGDGLTTEESVRSASSSSTVGEHTIIATRDVQNGQLSLRLDGVETTAALTIVPNTESGMVARLGSEASGATVFFDGNYYDLRVYDRVLTAQEISDYEAGLIDNLNPIGDEKLALGFGTPSVEFNRYDSTTDRTGNKHHLAEVSGPFPAVHKQGYALTANDFSGNGNHADNVGGVTQRPGIDPDWNIGYDWDGINDEINIPPVMDNVDCAFVFVFESDTNSVLNPLYSSRNLANLGWEISSNASGNLQIITNDSTWTLSQSLPVSTGSIHTLTVRRTSDGNATVTLDGTVATATGTGSPVAYANGPTHLGHTDTASEVYFDGAMYEVRMWAGTIPTQSVLNDIVNPANTTYRGTAEGNELIYMPMSKDLTGFGFGAELDGVADYWDITNDADFALAGDMSILMRFNLISLGVTNQSSEIFLVENGSSNLDPYFRISTFQGSGGVVNVSAGAASASQPSALGDSTLIGIRDVANDLLTLRYNGTESTAVYTETPSTASPVARIGSRTFNSPESGRPNAEYYDIIVLPRVPTAQEISDYEAGTLTADNAPVDALAAYSFGDHLFVNQNTTA